MRTGSDDRAREGESRVRAVVGVLLISSFVVILNETVMSVAIPKLMVDLDIAATTAQWLTTGFLLTMTVVIPTTGTVLQRFSGRAVFGAAMSAFAFGTLLAACAPGFSVLLVGRVVQACGTALTFPLLVTTVLNAVPARRRGSAMGLIAIVIAVAPAVGPTFAGAVLSVLPWRWLFGAILPIVVICLIAGLIVIPDLGVWSRRRIDALSVVLSSVAFGGLIYGVSELGADAAISVRSVVVIGVGAVSLAAFVSRQVSLQGSDRLLLDMRPFRDRPFVVGAVVLMICMAVLFGTLILLPLYLQNVRGMTVLQSGLVLLPGGLLMGLVAPLVGRTYDRFGPRPLVLPGTVLMMAAMAVMATYDASTPVGVVVGAHVAMSMGIGLVLTPAMTSALGCLDADLYPHGSAIVNTVQQFAGAAGTALFVSVMTVSAASSGGPVAHAEMAGIHTAFVWSVIVAAAAVVMSLFVTTARGETESVMPA